MKIQATSFAVLTVLAAAPVHAIEKDKLDCLRSLVTRAALRDPGEAITLEELPRFADLDATALALSASLVDKGLAPRRMETKLAGERAIDVSFRSSTGIKYVSLVDSSDKTYFITLSIPQKLTRHAAGIVAGFWTAAEMQCRR